MVTALLVMSTLLALVGVFVLTDAGQLLRIPKWAVVAYFRSHKLIIGLSITLFAVAVFLNAKQEALSTGSQVRAVF